MPEIIYKPREITLSPMQSLAFRTFLKPEILALACCTGFGGGKSMLLALIAAYFAHKFPGIYIMCGSPTYPMMKRTIWRTLNEVIPKGNIVRRNNQDMGLVLDFNEGDAPASEIICLSASVPVQNWQGANLGLILLDECEGITDAHYTQSKARLRQVVTDYDGTTREMPNKILVATNPPPNDHWLCRDFYYHRKTGHTLLQWTSLDNPFSPEAYKRTLLDTFHGEQRKRAVYGKIGTAFEGKVYDNFVPPIHVLDHHYARKIAKAATFRIYGMDHGYIMPFAFLEIVYWKKLEAWVVTKEFYGSRLSIAEKAQGIKKIYPEALEYPFHIYSDHAAQDRAELEREYGILTEAALKRSKRDKRKGGTTVDDSIQFIKSMFFTNERTGYPNLFISADCTNLINEIQSFRNAKSRQTEELQEYEYDGPNHAIDALRYALYTHCTKNPTLFHTTGEREVLNFGIETEEGNDLEQYPREDSYGTNDEADFGT